MECARTPPCREIPDAPELGMAPLAFSWSMKASISGSVLRNSMEFSGRGKLTQQNNSHLFRFGTMNSSKSMSARYCTRSMLR